MSVKAHGEGDLYHKYRPRKFEEIVGHDALAASIRSAVQDGAASAFMLTGPSGTGKTTTARIMALAANCDNPDGGEPCLGCDRCKAVLSGNCPDMLEMNAADARGIDDIRAMCANMGFTPMVLRKRVYILDEAHQLTKDAQNTLLKYLEDAPKHVMIILASTDPKKILATVRNRCQKYKFELLARGDMHSLIKDVVYQEDLYNLSPDILTLVVDAAEGSPRNGLVALQQVLQLNHPTAEAVADLLNQSEEDPNAIKLCFVVNDKDPKWGKIVPMYNEVKGLGAPALGMTLAGYFRNQLLKSQDPSEAIKLAKCLDLFLVPFDSGKLGENQIVAALFKSFMIKRTK